MTVLESRLNPGVVTNTQDYNWTDPTIPPVPGSLRFEVAAAILSGEDITFDETVNLGGGAKFGGPVTSANTINLQFGSIFIEPAIDPSTQLPVFKNVRILAPKSFDGAKSYVPVKWVGSAYPLSGHSNSGTDWSVLSISVAEQSSDFKFPSYRSVTLAGLEITNGRAADGAGINAHGFVNLTISRCQITNNNSKGHPSTSADPSTRGAGILTTGSGISVPGGGKHQQVTYGPIVSISDSHIDNNRTAENDTAETKGTDRGGGLYLGTGSSLFMNGSTVNNNSAENGGGGVVFEGGAFLQNETILGQKNLYTTRLQINASEISGNKAVSPQLPGDGGGLVIEGATAGVIATTTFAGNAAQKNGGAVVLSGLGNLPPPDGETPYQDFVGEVNFLACTFEGNTAAQRRQDATGEDIIADSGYGGGLYVDGVANRWFIVDATVSGNSTDIGRGGGMAVVPSKLFYDHVIEYFKDLNNLSLILDPQQDFPPAPQQPGKTYLEIDNSTMAFNKGGGAVDDTNVVHGGRGGGLAVVVSQQDPSPGVINFTSTIIAKNSVVPSVTSVPGGFGPDTWAFDDNSPTSVLLSGLGHNLIGVADSGKVALSGLTGTVATPLDPLLYSLEYNGGLTKTHAIGWTSPAYDAGLNVVPITLDQRGELRTRALKTDVGAYEATGIAVEFPNVFDFNTGTKTTAFPDQRSVIAEIIVYMDPLAAGETVHVVRTAKSPQGPYGDVPITTVVTTGVQYDPWNKAATRIVIDFQQSQNDEFTYQLKAFGLNDYSLNDGFYAIEIREPVVPFPGITHVVPPKTFHRLFGDLTGDEDVDAFDFQDFRTYFGSYDFAFDYDGDGDVDAVDFAEMRQRFGLPFP